MVQNMQFGPAQPKSITENGYIKRASPMASRSELDCSLPAWLNCSIRSLQAASLVEQMNLLLTQGNA